MPYHQCKLQDSRCLNTVPDTNLLKQNEPPSIDMFLSAARCNVKTPELSASSHARQKVLGCISCSGGTNVPNFAHIADYR